MPTSGRHESSTSEARWTDTHQVEILENERDPSNGRILRLVVWCLFLIVCTLVGSGIAEYRRLLPLAQERGLPTSVLMKESFRRIDPAFAVTGLLIGIAILATLEWVRRQRRAD